MAKWQDTFEELKKKKKDMEKTSTPSERKQVNTKYSTNTSYQNNLVSTKNNIDRNNIAYVKNTNVNNSSNKINTSYKEKNKDKKWYQQIFNKGAFDDGYDFGDVTKTILGTATDLTQDVSKGITSILEAPFDIGTNAVASVQDKLGYKDAAEKTRKFADRDLSDTISSRAANSSGTGILYNILTGTPENVVNPVGLEYDKNKSLGENVKSALKKNYLEDVRDEAIGYEKSSALGYYADKTAELVGYTLGLAYGGGALTKATGTAGAGITTKAGTTALGGSISGGNIGVTIAGKTLNLPTLAIIGGASSGLQEANSKEGVTEAERWTKALSGGVIEGVTEGLFGMFGVGGVTNQEGKELFEIIGEKASKKFTSSVGKTLAKVGFSSSGESIEELLSYMGNYFVDNKMIDKMGEADFSQDWDWAEVGEQMALAFVSSAIMQGGSTKINTNEAIKSAEEQLGRKLTTEEKGEVTQAVIEGTFEEKYNRLQEQQENVQNTENDVRNAQNNENIVQNEELGQENEQLRQISNQIQELENQLDTSQSAVQQQEILNQINILEKQYSAVQQQQEIAPTVIENQQENQQTQATSEQISNTTTQEVNSNLATEVESNALNNVKSEQQNTVVDSKTSERLESQIDNALQNKNSNGTSYLGKVTDLVSNKIKSLLGIEVKNRKHTLSDNDIRHMLKQHGNQEVETKKGQIAITREDIKNIPDIINNPDEITKGTNNKLGQTIRYIKRYNDNSTYVVEVAPDSSNALIIKTMWKKPSTLTNSIAPSSTSETQGSDISSTSSDNILQNTENVKSSPEYSMQQNEKNNTNSTPTQQELDNLEDIRLNKSGSEYANTYYDLEKKYGKANLIKGLNEYKSTGKALNTEQVVEQVSEQVEDAIAPIKKSINELKETMEEVTQVAEETKALREDLEAFYKQSQEDFKTINDNDVAPTMEYSTQGVTESNLEVESPLNNRDIDEVGDRKIKAYQYENPEVRPYFQKMAEYMLTDLKESTKGERLYNDQVYYDTNGESGWFGTKRNTTKDIADLLDNFNYTYADIKKGLEAIIEDHGAENIAVAKRIEFALDERLRNGYTDVSGFEVPADQDYINLLQEKEFSEYYSSIPTENIAPTSEDMQNDIIAPVNENVSKKPLKERYEAIEPNKANEDKYEDTPMIRVRPDKTAFEKRVMESAKEIEKELGYVPKDPTKESSYDLTDTSENQKIAKVLTEEPKATKKEQRLWATMKANLLDKGAVFEDVSIKNKNRDLMGKWDYTLTSEARAQNVIGNGHTEYDASTKTTKQTSKSLNDIVAEVENTGLKQEFYDYMYHKHNVDRMNLEQRAKEKIIDLNNMLKETANKTAKKYIEKQIDSLLKTANKPVFGNDVTSDVSQRVVDQYENENPVFMDYAQDVYDYVNADRQQLVKEGVISQATANLWSEMYPHYVPIRRVDSNGNNINVPLDTNRTGVNVPIKKATGGSSDILPLFDTMAMRTLQTYRATAKNSFGVELKNTLGTTIENQQTNIDEIIDSVDNQEGLLQEGKNGSNPTFTVFENGEKITYEITQDMYNALKPISESSMLSKTFKPLNEASSFHRGLLTEYNPVFMITNAVKDIQDVLINSQHTAKTYSKIPEAWAQQVKKGYWYQEYMANGGEQNSYFDSQENTFKTENKGIAKLLDIPPLSTISKMNNFIEMTPRLAEYIASREQGRSIEVSMLDAARVTTNFKAGGNITKWANRNGATFLNASVQGAMQQVRNVREANMNGLRGWANLATKFAMAGLPAILLNGLVWDDDDDYDELSDYVKQNYYVVWKKDDGTFIRIPKGRTVAVIQEAIQQIENAKTGDDEVDLKSFLDLVLTNLAPNNPIDNHILSPITQVMSNKTWYGEDLVPTRLQDLPANEQYDESTDTFSKWLGEKINVSPVKINYLLNQYSGGVGDVVLPVITPKATNDADSLGDYLLAPFKDKFTTNATMNNKNVGELFETSEELTTKAKSSKATDEDVLKNKFINSIKTEMNELYKQKREIQNSNLSKGEKYEQVLDVQEQINELSKYGLNNYEDVNISSNYASVGNRQYKLNADGEWEKLSDKQIKKQDNVINSLNISANDYWSNKEEYDYAYENPDKYKTITAITDYDAYKTYSKDIYDLKSDKDEDGKSISGSRKDKVISYVNELDLSIPQKAMMIRQIYSSFDNYNDEIIDYVSSLDVSYEDKVSILKGLDFIVYDDGSVGW